MLVLSRKLTEQIIIGDDVVVTVLQIRGNKVRIGISAPNEIRVVRAELGTLTTWPEVDQAVDQTTRFAKDFAQ